MSAAKSASRARERSPTTRARTPSQRGDGPASRARAILVGAAPLSRGWLRAQLSRLRLTPRDLVIGVDGGVDALKGAGCTPRFAVGDWDSVSTSRALSGIPHVDLPRDKDRSDLCFAIAAAQWAGATDLIALGVLGGRPDHHLAAIYELARAAAVPKAFRTVQARGEEGEVHSIPPGPAGWRAEISPGQVVSLFSPLGSASGIRCTGLKYRGRLPSLAPSSWGLSNCALGGEVAISARRGVLLVVLATPFKR